MDANTEIFTFLSGELRVQQQHDTANLIIEREHSLQTSSKVIHMRTPDDKVEEAKGVNVFTRRLSHDAPVTGAAEAEGVQKSLLFVQRQFGAPDAETEPTPEHMAKAMLYLQWFRHASVKKAGAK